MKTAHLSRSTLFKPNSTDVVGFNYYLSIRLDAHLIKKEIIYTSQTDIDPTNSTKHDQEAATIYHQRLSK